MGKTFINNVVTIKLLNVSFVVVLRFPLKCLRCIFFFYLLRGIEICMAEGKALMRLEICAELSVLSLLANAISIRIKLTLMKSCELYLLNKGFSVSL